MDAETEARIDAALEAKFPSTPLNHLSRTINRLAELLPKDHECEPIFSQLDAVGEYVHGLEQKVIERDESIRKLISALQYRWLHEVPVGRSVIEPTHEFQVVHDAQILIGDMEPLETIRKRLRG